MGARRNLTKFDINERYREKFDILVRFMIVAAEEKRFVSYNELTKILGISLEDLRDFAAFLGDFCEYSDFPYLNALIINTTEGMPGSDFFEWQKDKANQFQWGEYVAKCISYFHLTMDNKKRFQNTTGMTSSTNEFLSSAD